MKLIAFMIFVCLLAPSTGIAGGKHEAEYQAVWCAAEAGAAEYRLVDGTRCDCLTSTHAVEFDFARKWAEAIGQALHYSAMTGKRGGIVLIVGERDGRYAERLRRTIDAQHLPLDVWFVSAVD